MAKKSRRQKLPSEKDFEKLNAPKQEDSGAAPDSHSERDLSTPRPGGRSSRDDNVPSHFERSGASPCHFERSEAESRNPTPEGTNQPTYNDDGGISVSLAGDVTGVGNSGDGEVPPEEALDEESFEELFGESPQSFLNQVNAKPLTQLNDEPVVHTSDAGSTDAAAAGAPVRPDPEPTDDSEPDDASKPPEVLILVGSPHRDGKSALFGRKLREYLRLSGFAVTLFEISKYPIAACTGCGVCSQTGECCIKGDSWNVLSRHMNSCAALVVIAPVYFAGPSGWLKAALDRCQMYWARKYVLRNWVPRKRPAHLVVIGDGGDPFGTEPLETICTSALNCADLRIEPQRIHRLIGDAFDLSYAVQVAGAVRADVPRSR